ncbi:MAG: polysaccharide biosynthesis tyrosine autokinase [Verrucomicrobiota bacterium]
MREQQRVPAERAVQTEPAGYAAYGYAGVASSLQLPRYVKYIKRLWWVPVLTLAVALSAAAVLVTLQPPAFKSKARLLVTGKMNIKDNATTWTEELQFFFGTQVELLQSDKIEDAAKVRVQTMNPNLAPSPVALRVSQTPKSAMFVLEAKGSEPAYTQAYLNAVIDEYLTYKKQVRAGSSDETLTSLSEQVFQHEKELKAEQEKLTKYLRENNVPVLQEQAAAAGQYLGRLNAQMSDLQMENQFLGSAATLSTNADGTNVLTAASSAMLRTSALPTVNVPPEVALARQQLQILKLQRDELAPFLRPQHPKMQKFEEDIARAEKMLAMFDQESRDQMEPTRQAQQLKIDAVKDLIGQWEAKLLEATGKLADYDQMKANVQRLQTVNDRLVGMLQSLDVNKTLDQEVVSVMERASISEPAKVSLTVAGAAACFVGVLGGLMLVFLVARLDDRCTSINELMQRFEEEIVGQVPDVRRLGRKKRLQLVETDDERHMFAESYRNIRSSILYMPTEGVKPRTLLITSAIPNEGKSTVSANLARTMAFAGGKVLLIDGDMRKGKLHEYFGLERGAGFSKLLYERGKLEDYLVETSLPNLFLIPSGDPIPDASERFLSDHFAELLRNAEQSFDHIIIDSAPVFAADDAPTLAPKMDGVLFVVRGSFTKAAMAQQALDILYQRQAKVLGLVFNRADTKAGSYYYYKYADYYYSGHTNGNVKA